MDAPRKICVPRCLPYSFTVFLLIYRNLAHVTRVGPEFKILHLYPRGVQEPLGIQEWAGGREASQFASFEIMSPSLSINLSFLSFPHLWIQN